MTSQSAADMNNTQKRAKFRELAGLALTPQGVVEVESAIDGLERWTSASVLTDLLRRHCRPEWR